MEHKRTLSKARLSLNNGKELIINWRDNKQLRKRLSKCNDVVRVVNLEYLD